MRESLQAIAVPLQLKVTEAAILVCCYEHEPRDCDGIPQGRFVEWLSISPAQISTLLGHLQTKQLVNGFRPIENRRQQLWRLTKQGRDLSERILRLLSKDIPSFPKLSVDSRPGPPSHPIARTISSTPSGRRAA